MPNYTSTCKLSSSLYVEVLNALKTSNKMRNKQTIVGLLFPVKKTANKWLASAVLVHF